MEETPMEDISIRSKFNIILKILNIDESEFIDKYLNTSISFEQINRIVEILPNFYSDKLKYKRCLNNKDLIDFINLNKQFVLEGILISIEEEDYNLYLNGLKAPYSENNINLISALIRDHISEITPPDICDNQDGFIKIIWE